MRHLTPTPVETSKGVAALWPPMKVRLSQSLGFGVAGRMGL